MLILLKNEAKLINTSINVMWFHFCQVKKHLQAFNPSSDALFQLKAIEKRFLL